MGWDYRATRNGREVLSISKELLNWTDTYAMHYRNPADEIPGLLLAFFALWELSAALGTVDAFIVSSPSRIQPNAELRRSALPIPPTSCGQVSVKRETESSVMHSFLV